MSNFKLTLKRSDDRELDSKFVKAIMKRLYQDFELLDDPDSCNCELSELFTERQIKDLSVFVNGNNFPTSVNDLNRLILVGENRKGDNCPNCGYPKYYYTGGLMLCNQCEHSEAVDYRDCLDGDGLTSMNDIADYSGRVVI